MPPSSLLLPRPYPAAATFHRQMYKSKDDEYLIDLQRLCGDPFTFMEVVSQILVDMRM